MKPYFSIVIYKNKLVGISFAIPLDIYVLKRRVEIARAPRHSKGKKSDVMTRVEIYSRSAVDMSIVALHCIVTFATLMSRRKILQESILSGRVQ